MAAKTYLIIVCWVLALLSTDGLFCYQCASAGTDGYCKADTNELAKSAEEVLTNLENMTVSDGASRVDDLLIPHIKLCGGKRPFCLIEEVTNSQTSGVLAYLRDCSDGKTFSFNMTRFKNLKANNFTTCAYDTRGYLTCVTLCNSTHFCNGPITSGVPFTFSSPLLVAILMSVIAILKSSIFDCGSTTIVKERKRK